MSWEHSQPMPMRGSPCVVSESNAVSYIEKLSNKPRVFLFSDSERAVPNGWGYVASVRAGTPLKELWPRLMHGSSSIQMHG